MPTQNSMAILLYDACLMSFLQAPFGWRIAAPAINVDSCLRRPFPFLVTACGRSLILPRMRPVNPPGNGARV